jgi:AcrR family transcriptional regulator
MNDRSFIFCEIAEPEEVTTITPPASRGERTRRSILEAAERLFLTHGFNGTSMREIAREAGNIAVGGIYNHFGSKEEIFRALLTARSPYPKIVAVLETLEADDSVTLLSEAFSRLQGLAAEHLVFFRLALIDLEEFEGNTLRTLVGDVLPSVFRFAERVRLAGGIRSDLSPFVMIRAFVGMLLGYILTSLIGYSGGRPVLPSIPDIDEAQWQAAVIDVFLHGVIGQKDE